MIVYRVVRDDGAVMCGPYPMADSCSFAVDTPVTGSHTYSVEAKYDSGGATDEILEIHLTGMAIKR